MNIEIRNKALEILERFLDRSFFLNLNYIRLNVDKILLSISKDEADLIVDALTEAFLKIGLNDDSEPNNIGLEIENVIDLFSDLLYEE